MMETIRKLWERKIKLFAIFCFVSLICTSVWAKPKPVELTAEEKAYIKAHPEISIAIDTSWAPYGFKDAMGKPSGIIPNFIELVAQRAGLKVKYVAEKTYAEAIKAGQSGRTQFISGLATDPRIVAKYDLQITKPYLNVGYCAVTKRDIPDLYGDGAKYKVAVCTNSYAEAAMRQNMPSYQFVEFHTNQECLDAVMADKVDIALLAGYSASYYNGWHEYDKLILTQINNFNWDLAFGVNKNVDPVLIHIINKSISSISENEANQAIYEGAVDASNASRKASDILYEQPVLAAFVFAVIAALLVIAIFLQVLSKRKIKELEKERQYKEDIEQKDKVLNSVPSGIGVFEVTKAGIKELYINDSFYRLLQDTRERRQAAHKGDFMEGIYSEDKDKIIATAQELLAGKDIRELIYRVVRKDGTLTWLRLTAAVTKREADRVELYCSLVLVDKEIEAEQASVAKTEFFSRLSHDMRTPMNGILGMVALSEEENSLPILKDNLGKIKSSGEYLLGLINDTLDFQKIESGKLELENTIVYAGDLMQDIVTMMSTAAKEKGVEFKIVTHNIDTDWYVRTDPLRMKQIFINLLSNAIKFTPKGGKVVMNLELLKREGMLSQEKITVTDTGCGMSPEFLKNGIFKPFSQEHSTLNRHNVGTGLGLSIAKKLVELMGGSIEVESEVGVGTKFTVYISFERVDKSKYEAANKVVESKEHNAKEALAGKHILLAEDHPLNAEIAKKLLSKVGCEVAWTLNGKDCVELFEKSPLGSVDLILMDIRMPIMNGLEATRHIRDLNREDAKTVPIVAMTANAYKEDVEKCLAAGMNGHIPKPIEPKVMYETMAEVLRKV